MTAFVQALRVHALGPDLAGVAVGAWPVAAPGPGEVAVQVRAAGLNFPDLLQTQGLYQHRPPLPFVCGLEGSGVVAEVGADVALWRVGDAVYFSHPGSVAERVVLPAASVHALPAGLSFEEAASFFVTGVTAWVALVRRAQLQRGEWLLVNGARGGVGWACLQLGQHLGARLIATASEPARLRAWEQQGVQLLRADATLPDGVKALTQGQGVQVLADPVGGELFHHSLRSMAWEGRVVVLGFAAGEIPTMALNRALMKGLSILGVRAGETARRTPRAGAENRAAVEQLAAQGVLRPAIGLRVPLAQAREALGAMARREVTGKIVVTME